MWGPLLSLRGSREREKRNFVSGCQLQCKTWMNCFKTKECYCFSYSFSNATEISSSWTSVTKALKRQIQCINNIHIVTLKIRFPTYHFTRILWDHLSIKQLKLNYCSRYLNLKHYPPCNRPHFLLLPPQLSHLNPFPFITIELTYQSKLFVTTKMKTEWKLLKRSLS